MFGWLLRAADPATEEISKTHGRWIFSIPSPRGRRCSEIDGGKSGRPRKSRNAGERKEENDLRMRGGNTNGETRSEKPPRWKKKKVGDDKLILFPTNIQKLND